MEIQEYVDQKKELNNALLKYIENDSEDQTEFKNIVQLINQQKIQENDTEFKLSLRIIISISQNHRRCPNFFSRIEQILSFFADKIKQTFSNFEIFNIFQNDKRILLFLFNNKILEFDQNIYTVISLDKYFTESNFFHFFRPEIKLFESEQEIKKETNEEEECYEPDSDVLNIFEEKRQIGENDSYVCQIIRNDSIDEFVIYVNQINLKLSSSIKESIYETNSFLIENKKTTLIEYSAFFGSIQIFQYLKMNEIELKPSLWLYAIHGRNAEIIHLLEDNHVHPPDMNDSYEECLKEAIKCHHNEIANYIHDNLMNENKLNENVLSSIFHYYNYFYFPADLNNTSVFKCLYNDLLKSAANENSYEIVHLLLSLQETEINSIDFSGCDKLTQITIPPTIKAISSSAFCGCFSLVRIIFESPCQFTTIETCTFYCALLRQITIPASVTEIKSYAFNGCSSLSQVNFEKPSSLKSIEEHAFNECSSLAEIQFPSSIENIELFIFECCTSLKKVSFESPSSLLIIKSYSFANSAVKEVTIPSSVTSIEKNAFTRCNSLEKISFDDHSNLASIGEYAFSECLSLIEITIPSSIKEIGKDAFFKCSSLKQLIFDDVNSLNLINSYAFSHTSLKRIQIPASVKTIDNHAFFNCPSLEEVSFDENSSLLAINDHAFDRCSSLVHINVPSSVASIGESVFQGCSSLQEIEIPSLTKVIKESAFGSCYSINQILIPSSVVEIESYAFSGCSSLSKISISNSVLKIGSYCFSGCSSLVEVQIPSSVTEIGSFAFNGCSMLVNILIPSSVMKIDSYAFNECTSLVQISIPNSVSKIGNKIFKGCSALKKIYIPSYVDLSKIGIDNNVNVIQS